MPVGDLVASGTDLARCLRPRSSGTSGEPFTVYWDAGGACVFYALTARALRMAGARLTDTMMVIGPGYYPEGLLVQRLGLGRVINVSPLQEPPALLAALAEERPQIVHAYSSVLKSLVAHLRAVGVRPHRPRVLVASADYLDEGTRSACRELFGVAPIQMYGAAETGRIGAECRLKDGIHVFTDFVVPELLPVGGEEGAAERRVVLTDLTNFTMPFLRYDQGDLAEAVVEKCGCGMAFPRLRLVRARASDVVRLPSGATVSALKLGAPLWAARGVDAFKIIQPSISTLIVRVVREDGSEASAIHEAVAALAALVPDLYVELEFVPRIERDPSGKVTGFQPLADLPG